MPGSWAAQWEAQDASRPHLSLCLTGTGQELPFLAGPPPHSLLGPSLCSDRVCGQKNPRAHAGSYRTSCCAQDDDVFNSTQPQSVCKTGINLPVLWGCREHRMWHILSVNKFKFLSGPTTTPSWEHRWGYVSVSATEAEASRCSINSH